MVSFFGKHRKKVALLLFINFFVSFLAPIRTWAITSGPAQPEMTGFQPIGSSDMVDLSSGDFKYNIPLMDVGGYPLNLSYNAGAGIEDEASWVGYGWNLNPGAVNRQMKALPDDFRGDVEAGDHGDRVEKTVNLKKKVKVGVSMDFKADLFGFEKFGAKLMAGLGLKASLYKDNYYGWSASLGINPALDVAKEHSTTETNGVIKKNYKSTGNTAGLGISSSSRDGAGISPNLSLTWNKQNRSDRVGLNIGFDYNSRQGMQSQSLGLTYSSTGKASEAINKTIKGADGKDTKKEIGGKNSSHIDGGASYIDNAAMTYTPTIDIPRKTDAFSFSFHIGAEFVPVKGVTGGEGSYSAETVPLALRYRSVPAYGFLYEHETNTNAFSEALTDLNREKDVPYFEGVPVLPIPILTNDNFNVTSQNGSGQFKLYRNGSGITHDPYLRTQGTTGSLGIDFGGGNIFNIGGNVYVNSSVSKVGKWSTGNNYYTLGKFKQPNAAQPLIEHAYFKKTGEMLEADNDRITKLGKDKPIKVNIGSSETAMASLSDNYSNYSPSSLETLRREKRTSNFNYLTASEASVYGFDKKILSYEPLSSDPFTCSVLSPSSADELPRVSTDAENYMRKRHHISEISVLDGGGTKMVYGIPVYNKVQVEVTFAVDKPATGTPANDARIKGLVDYTSTDNSRDNVKGRDNYYSRDVIPPYATSYLLTSILSSDYQDRTGDGISDDDYGNAVKFNYSKLSGCYKWRTPYDGAADGFAGKANFNQGMLGDDFDDKANYTYGEKEIWYMHSIESKNAVALFFLSDREDGLGVNGENGGKRDSWKLKKLDKIVLYAKEDFRKNGSNAMPIKTVHFEYDYSIGSGYPNHTGTGGSGKLALKRVYFTYAKNEKGKSNPYQFFYKTAAKDALGTVIDALDNPAYAARQTDRWGTYKHTDYNPSMLAPGVTPTSSDHFTNAEFPYTLQDRITDEFAGMWNLEQVKLPSGGEIRVDYESDDYAYVQNKRATAMFQVYGVGNNLAEGGTFSNSGDDFIDANTICIRSKKNVDPQELVKGTKFLYGKFYMNFFSDVYDYVPGYAEIESVSNDVNTSLISGEYLYKVKIKKVQAEGLKSTDYVNPFSVGAWQYLRNNLPHRAYPGFDDNTAGDGNVGTNVIAAIKALGQAILNFGELFENPNAKFYRLKRSNMIVPEQSWVRLVEPTGKKKGGGHRVRKITLTDNWAEMLNDTDKYTNNSYGQVYEYTIKEGNTDISSGVASYEPGMGSDENPCKQPVYYSKEVQWGLDYNTYIEEPVGESYMPSPSVCYSKVTVKSFGATGEASAAKLGYTTNEFYTAKDFPLIVEKTGPVALTHNPKLILSLLGSVVDNSVSVSQGISVIQNDMHGKPKATKTYDRNNNLLSSEEYTYQVKDPTAEVQQLENEVDLLRKDGKVGRGMIGQDMEFYTDMRYQQSNSTGVRVGIYGGGGFLAFLLPTPFLGVNVGGNIANSTFHSASAIKVVSKYGILKKVTKMVNGSYANSESLMWDPETGEVLLTRTHNEFDQPVYNLNYPAHWAFEMMGPAYQNNASVLTDLSTDGDGQIIGTPEKLALLREGDQLVDVDGLLIVPPVYTEGGSSITPTDARYWVVLKTPASGPIEKYFINSFGETIPNLENRTYRIDRSGYSNGAASGMASIVCLKNPIVNGAIQVDANSGIIDAKAVVYSDKWSSPYLGMLKGASTSDDCAYTESSRVIPNIINPYFHNLRGQWRPSYSYAFHAQRNNDVPAVSSSGSNISKTGTYTAFSPFYTFSGGGIDPVFPGLTNLDWVWAQRPTLFSTKGGEIDSEDALNIHSAAVYGHNEQLAIAVGKSARVLEMKYEGFEDPNESGGTCCIKRTNVEKAAKGFQFYGAEEITIDNTVSHTGKSSAKILADEILTVTAGLAANYNNLEEMVYRDPVATPYYVRSHNDLIKGFMPLQNKAYILSFWIKDNDAIHRAPKLELTQDGSVTPVDLSTDAKWPIVEGWKRIEHKFTTGSGSNLTFTFKATANIYLDDIRVFPAEGQMKSYAYDNISQRLMAELDENNFATFYEYDDEGTLVRVKKETDRGIKTIKESRQYTRKTYVHP